MAEIKEKREVAVKLMRKIGLYEAYIKGFEKNNSVCYYERFGGYWAHQNEKLQQKIKDIEERYNYVVYAVTHEYFEFGECYSFMIVTDYEEEWEELICEQGKNTYYAFAYVWNVTDDDCSEFGTIAIQSFGGGIRRIG